ncbi:hypothetical protein F9L16_23330 [Agarivorans sp. B2Z047]|uniref:hypothetical protein n=1 Tax=Agarivorans sp. B2Z047 TaxID=2652721 RepID=UPI00128E0304|nr:hypothetical protein [Agarivorans sp. B2Z047]MPW31892.1 hypothetical protein [Agarivorans sp. B2Z047]UQN40974.1 hypothetical protein LQZ07_14455 [Agarivorans sp. B2Z047]
MSEYHKKFNEWVNSRFLSQEQEHALIGLSLVINGGVLREPDWIALMNEIQGKAAPVYCEPFLWIEYCLLPGQFNYLANAYNPSQGGVVLQCNWLVDTLTGLLLSRYYSSQIYSDRPPLTWARCTHLLQIDGVTFQQVVEDALLSWTTIPDTPITHIIRSTLIGVMPTVGLNHQRFRAYVSGNHSMPYNETTLDSNNTKNWANCDDYNLLVKQLKPLNKGQVAKAAKIVMCWLEGEHSWPGMMVASWCLAKLEKKKINVQSTIQYLGEVIPTLTLLVDRGRLDVDEESLQSLGETLAKDLPNISAADSAKKRTQQFIFECLEGARSGFRLVHVVRASLITPETQIRILRALAQKPEVAAMVALMRQAGVRIGEVAKLQSQDVAVNTDFTTLIDIRHCPKTTSSRRTFLVDCHGLAFVCAVSSLVSLAAPKDSVWGVQHNPHQLGVQRLSQYLANCIQEISNGYNQGAHCIRHTNISEPTLVIFAPEIARELNVPQRSLPEATSVSPDGRYKQCSVQLGHKHVATSVLNYTHTFNFVHWRCAESLLQPISKQAVRRILGIDRIKPMKGFRIQSLVTPSNPAMISPTKLRTNVIEALKSYSEVIYRASGRPFTENHDALSNHQNRLLTLCQVLGRGFKKRCSASEEYLDIESRVGELYHQYPNTLRQNVAELKLTEEDKKSLQACLFNLYTLTGYRVNQLAKVGLCLLRDCLTSKKHVWVFTQKHKLEQAIKMLEELLGNERVKVTILSDGEDIECIGLQEFETQIKHQNPSKHISYELSIISQSKRNALSTMLLIILNCL